MLQDQQVLTAILISIGAFGLGAVFFSGRRFSGRSFERALSRSLDRLGEAAQHHVEVNAVLALTETMKRDPQLLANLSEYSREVYGAALLYRVNALGNSIKAVEGEAHTLRQRAARSPGWDKELARANSVLQSLYAQLDAANAAVQQLSTI